MVVKGNAIKEVDHRMGYDLGSVQNQIGHFAIRVTTPKNPFMPEKHGENRFWYILEGEALVTVDGEKTDVEAGDLAILLPWTQHSLQTDTSVRWICFG